MMIQSQHLLHIQMLYLQQNYTVQISGSIGTPISIRQNKDIILNTIAYLSDREDTIRIRKDTGLVSFDAITEQENRVVPLDNIRNSCKYNCSRYSGCNCKEKKKNKDCYNLAI